MDNFNIYPNTRLGKLVKAKKLEEILDLCDDFCPGEPPEYFFDRWTCNTIIKIFGLDCFDTNKTYKMDVLELPEKLFRSWHSFNSILDIYRTGLLHLNNDMCALVLQVTISEQKLDFHLKFDRLKLQQFLHLSNISPLTIWSLMTVSNQFEMR